MQLQNPVGVLTPTLDAPVLAVLARVEQSFTGRQVHQLAGRGTEQGVRNALARLVEQGVVLQSRAGSAYLYQLNRRHLAAPHLAGLAAMRDELFSRWRRLIEGWPVQPRVVVLFGSAARGEMRPDSDIDLLVVTDAEQDELETDLAQLQADTAAWTGNDARVLHVRSSQVTRDEPVLVSAAEEGVVVAGDGTWLRWALRKQVDRGA
jgi:predicted nucleotidyltransferase